MSKTERFLKIDEVIEIVGIGKTKTNELIAQNKFIKPIRINGFSNRLFSLLELEEWMNQQKQKRD